MRLRPVILSGFAAATSIALTASIAIGAERGYQFSGKTKKNGSGVVLRVSCAKGFYVKNSGRDSGTIFDAPFINRSGTARGVRVGSRPTSTVKWGHAGTRLATGIEIWVQNDRADARRALTYRITLRCTNKRGSAWVILVPKPGGPLTKTETSYTFSGSTKRSNDGTKHTISCGSGQYVKNSGENSGTVFDVPFMDRSGTANGVAVGFTAASSVAWGHIGSRLATGIEIWVQNDKTHSNQSLAFHITVKCTDSQDDAWVIFG